MDWMNDLELYFQNLGNDLDTLVAGFNYLVDFAVKYLWISGGVVVLILVLMFAINSKINQLREDNNKIAYQLEQIRLTLKGGNTDGTTTERDD